MTKACNGCGQPSTHSLNGVRYCPPCALSALSAFALDRGGLALEQELPLAPRSPQRAHRERKAVRRAARSKAEREAMKRLKLMHLSDWNALVGEEMRRAGETPTVPRPLDIQFRHLAAHRLRVLVERSTFDGR